MSTEPRLTAPQLPAELSNIEACLQQFSPAGSAINRDALMYQAGWAAAAAQQPTKTPWLWPATTGVLAAALLLLITLPTASPLQPTGTERMSSSPSDPNIAIEKQFAVSLEPMVVRAFPVPLKRYSPKASLLAMRDRALRQEFDDLLTDALAEEGPAAVTTTSRDLLQEFLPELHDQKSLPRQPKPWWHGFNLGETS